MDRDKTRQVLTDLRMTILSTELTLQHVLNDTASDTETASILRRLADELEQAAYAVGAVKIADDVVTISRRRHRQALLCVLFAVVVAVYTVWVQCVASSLQLENLELNREAQARDLGEIDRDNRFRWKPVKEEA